MGTRGFHNAEFDVMETLCFFFKSTQRYKDFALTQQEADILALYANGLTAKAIGDSLFVTPRRVESASQTLYQKLKVSNRVQAVAYALQLGIIAGSQESQQSISEAIISLSKTEFKIFQFFVYGGDGVTNGFIAKRCKASDLTVRRHLRSMHKKLKTNSKRKKLVKIAEQYWHSITSNSEN